MSMSSQVIYIRVYYLLLQYALPHLSSHLLVMNYAGRAQATARLRTVGPLNADAMLAIIVPTKMPSGPRVHVSVN